jgi:hypothetical protein
MRTMVTTNIETELDIANGTRGVVEDVILTVRLLKDTPLTTLLQVASRQRQRRNICRR